tara:strand:+ start:252 stop:1190 length:939 start_codon:yes stop_codon:yes gene_type:complete
MDKDFTGYSQKDIYNFLSNDFAEWHLNLVNTDECEINSETKDDEKILNKDVFGFISEAISFFVVGVRAANCGMWYMPILVSLESTCNITKNLNEYFLQIKDKRGLTYQFIYTNRSYRGRGCIVYEGWKINKVSYCFVCLGQNNVYHLQEKNPSHQRRWTEWTNSTVQHERGEDRFIPSTNPFQHVEDYNTFYKHETGLAFFQQNVSNSNYKSLDELVAAAPVPQWHRPALKKLIIMESGLANIFITIKALRQTKKVGLISDHLLPTFKGLLGINMFSDDGKNNIIGIELDNFLKKPFLRKVNVHQKSSELRF